MILLDGINPLAVFFLILALFGTSLCSTSVDSISKHLPEVVLSFLKFGRANIGNRGKSAKILSKIEVPKRWFLHFYVWAVLFQLTVTMGVMKTYLWDTNNYNGSGFSSWLIFLVKCLTQGSQGITVSETTTIIAILLFQIHVIRRLYETLFVAVYSNTKMNVFHYLVGYIHYTGASLAMISASPGFASKQIEGLDILTSLSLPQLLGICLVIYGNYQQYLAHKGLADLRKGSGNQTASTEHKIPRGGMFELISCPNYYAEILVYLGFTVLLGIGNIAWVACTLWVISNQVASGLMNHKWYHTKFQNRYPKQRKAVIPYLM